MYIPDKRSIGLGSVPENGNQTKGEERSSRIVLLIYRVIVVAARRGSTIGEVMNITEQLHGKK